MQTFLPSSNFNISAQMLDSRRLNKQILEGYQILNVISNDSPTAGWRNHPAVKMWRGHEMTLLSYINSMILEAKQRGIKTDTNESNLNALYNKNKNWWSAETPSWLNDRTKVMRVITTHKARLFDKDPLFYAHFAFAKHSIYNKPCCDGCNYYWVTHETKENK